MNRVSATAAKAIDAYGGADLWLRGRSVRAVVSAGGLAFTLKRRPVFRRAVVECDIQRPRCRLTPIGRRADVTGVLDGRDVQLEDASGTVLARRESARSCFPFGRRALWWDDMDMAWFACYAFWNYFTLPRLLMTPEIAWSELAPGHLRADFPAHIPTHSPVQHFRFDPASGLLLRHDYTAEVVAPVARAAHRVLRHSQQGGVSFPSERLVTPIGFRGDALPVPVLIRIFVHDFAVAA